MPKAGQAQFTVQQAAYHNSPAWEYKLLFKSQGMLETFYKMRDTISDYFSSDNQLLFSSKQTDEGGFFLLDELTFNHDGNNPTVRSYRKARNGVRIDTTMRAAGCVFDMLGTVMYLRSIDWAELKNGRLYTFKVVVGRDIINVHFRYAGAEIIKLADATRFNSHHFYVDVYDPAFTQSKEAAEVWVAADSNHIPIRVRAKLKVGSADVHYRDADNLQFPLSSRILQTK
jgi:hypothetical protein